MKRFFIVFLAFSLLLSLTACQKKRSAANAVSEIVDAEACRPSGQLYYLSAKEGDEGYAPDDMLLSVYGFDRSLKGLEEGAVWLSECFHPFEAAVFVCSDYRSAEDVAIHLKNRLALLQSNAAEAAELCKMKVEEYRNYVDNGIVIISGDRVALIVSSDPRTAKRAFLSAG